VVANSFCIRKSLIRKANLAAHVEACNSKTMARESAGGGSGTTAQAQASVGHFVPESLVVDLFTATTSGDAVRWHGSRRAAVEAAVDEAVGEALEGGGVWLLKPSMGNKGADLHLVRRTEDVVRAVTEWPDALQWVLQRYVALPLTALGGRKFHLRVYVMARGALDVFVYREALVLLASLPHGDVQAAASGELAGASAHSLVTNTCVAATREGFDEAGSVLLLSELPGALDSALGPEAERVVRRAYAGVRECMARLFASLQGSVGGFMPLPNAYELYGVDFVVRETDSRPMLLEVNAGPDLKQTGGRLRTLIASMMGDVFDTSVLPLARAKAAGRFLAAGEGSSWASVGETSAAWDSVEDVALPDSRGGVLPGRPGGFRLGAENGWDPVLSLDWGVGDVDIGVSG